MIAILDYGCGNILSIHNMLKRIGVNSCVTSDPSIILYADKLILPGVGSFDYGVKQLKESKFYEALLKMVIQEKVPILGICLGMQLLANRSEEGKLPGLGWLDAESVCFNFEGANAGLKIPHMGWNQLTVAHPHPLLTGLEEVNRFYFVHSYHVVCANADNVLATTSYGFNFTSVVITDNIMGVQFHPEKSHKFGMCLLKNFAELV